MEFTRLLFLVCVTAYKVPDISNANVPNSTVVATQGVDVVTLQCEYVLENKDSTYNIKWLTRNVELLERHSSGLIQTFFRKFSLGDGCSLRLFKPEIKDSGRYTVNIFLSGEQETYAKGEVELVVKNVPHQTTSASVTGLETSCLHWYTFIPQIALSLLGIVRLPFLVGFHMFVTRNTRNSMEGTKRYFYYFAMVMSTLMFVIAMIYAAAGFVTREIIYYTVCNTMAILGCVGLLLHDCYLQRRVAQD